MSLVAFVAFFRSNDNSSFFFGAFLLLYPRQETFLLLLKWVFAGAVPHKSQQARKKKELPTKLSFSQTSSGLSGVSWDLF